MNQRALFVVALFSLLAVACDPVGTVRGTVVDGAKAPIADANVVLDCGGGGRTVTTDAQGKYIAQRAGFLSPQCEIEATKDGYSKQRQRIGSRCTDTDKEHCRTAVLDVELVPTK